MFHKIHSLTDVLFSYLQKLSFDILSSWIKIDAILQKIQELRNDFDTFLKLQNVTLEHPDRAEEVLFLHVILGPIFAFFLMKKQTQLLSSQPRWSRGHKAQGQAHKKIRGQGQKQPFRGQTLSRSRTGMLEVKAKDQGHKRKCSQKKRSSKVFSGDLKKKGSSKIFFRRSPVKNAF